MTWRREADLRYDDRMPRWLHVGLCNRLQEILRPRGDCNGTLRHSVEFVRQHGMQVSAARAWLHDHGACCDCEVVYNTVPWRDLEES